jgi:hypothetical protein
MKNILLIIVLALAGWYGWGKYEAHVRAQRAAEAAGKSAPATSSKPGAPAVSFFTCDGRDSCIQMTSCEEAKFFLKNCPGMNPEANREGASCEKQWCR